MSNFQSFSNCYDNNHEADDSSKVFDADRVTPDEVPSLPPASQEAEGSPQSFTSELLRRINSQRSLAEPSTVTATATATKNEEISTNESSSSSSKKRSITNSSSHSSRKKTRRSSCLKKQSQPQDQSCVNKSDSEVEDENGLDEVVINQSSSSSSSQISTTKLTKHELRWKSKFEELRAYKQLHGNTNVPQRYKKLGRWVSHQRTEYKKFQANKESTMTSRRIEKLESIGFAWVSQIKGPRSESKWNKRFNELKDYKDLHGHTNVPRSENKQLGKWVGTQRAEYRKLKANKKSAITPERIEMLESIGFQWSYRPNPAP